MYFIHLFTCSCFINLLVQRILTDKMLMKKIIYFQPIMRERQRLLLIKIKHLKYSFTGFFILTLRIVVRPK